MEQFVRIVTECGLAIIGQTANLVPADKKLYALRDVTATIDNIPLIASSIMSKKLASGSNVIVLDVKTGSGAFMKDPLSAKQLARIMVEIGNKAGRKTRALITDMNQPLGQAVGNALEVKEAIMILQGEQGVEDTSLVSADLIKVSKTLACQMLILGGLYRTEKEAFLQLDRVLKNGEALKRLMRMITAQGGKAEVVNNPHLLPQASRTVPASAPCSGYITAMATEEMGLTALLLGAGRVKKGDPIDPAVGFWMQKRLGDWVEKGEELAIFYINNENNLNEARQKFLDAITISKDDSEFRQQSHSLIYDVIE